MQKNETKIDDRVIAININRTYREGLNADDLYDNTRGIWRLQNARAEKADYAFAVYEGIIKEIYRLEQWHPAGSTKYRSRQFNPNELLRRYEFVGTLAPEEIREKYIGKLLPKRHAGNPILYFNC